MLMVVCSLIHSYADGCLFLDSFEVHTLFEDSSTVHSDKAGDDDWGPLGNLKPAAKAAGSGDFSVKAKYSKVKLGVSHLPMHQPGSNEYEAVCKRIQLFHDRNARAFDRRWLFFETRRKKAQARRKKR